MPIILKHGVGKVMEATLPSGRVIERKDWFFVPNPQGEGRILIPAKVEGYESHFIWEPRLPPGVAGWAHICTCGAQGIIVFNPKTGRDEMACYWYEGTGGHTNLSDRWV